MAIKQITAKQQYWLGHVKAAQVSAGTIAEYASRHDLRLKTLYQWKSKLIKLGLHKRGTSSTDFLPIRAQPVKPFGKAGCTIHLSNGARIDLTGELDNNMICSIITSAGMKQ